VLTIDQAMQYAADHYPTVRAAVEQVNASTAGVDVARSAYLPRLDSLWQSSRATANNIFGQVLPQGVIPAMSGPVLPSTSSQSVWGSATGALFSWEPFDFGLRD
jgi:outer membrane protein TolC